MMTSGFSIKSRKKEKSSHEAARASNGVTKENQELKTQGVQAPAMHSPKCLIKCLGTVACFRVPGLIFEPLGGRLAGVPRLALLGN